MGMSKIAVADSCNTETVCPECLMKSQDNDTPEDR